VNSLKLLASMPAKTALRAISFGRILPEKMAWKWDCLEIATKLQSTHPVRQQRMA
jgi:hypothetical protein